MIKCIQNWNKGECLYMLYYCKKCGRQRGFEVWDKRERVCSVCNSQLFEIPHEYTDNFRWRDGDGKQAVIEELVKPSPEFDQYLFDHRDEILAKQSAESNTKMAIGKAIVEGKKVSRQEMLSGKLNENRIDVSCPYCHSYNTKKITVSSKAVHTALFGLWSIGRNSKNYHCNQCGSEW